jgi:general secretion pathway protein G
MRRVRQTPHRNGGFTLIELVVVMTIIAILAGAVVLQVTNRTEHAKRARAIQDIATFETALDLYKIDNGSPPTTEQGLQALRTKPNDATNWNGPYIKKPPIDPWGTEYVYRYPGQLNPDSYDVISYAKDKKPGGTNEFDEDVTNAEE